MIINGERLPTLAVYPRMITVPDCNVYNTNKIGSGNGEAKFYIGSKTAMYEFYGEEGFTAKCFMLKADLKAYLLAIKNEYEFPSQNYRAKEALPELWAERMGLVEELDDVIFFDMKDQYQIEGERGYVNSKDEAYKLLRKIALPLVSYIYIEKVGVEEAPLFYWKLFVDFDAIWERQNGPLVFNYGRARDNEPEQPAESRNDERRTAISQARNGQGKYREKLLEQCPYCPFTRISDERLLIASHIKPWASSTDEEKIDPYNGYILSPLFDKLFDKGFITFKENRHIVLSDFISPYTWRQLDLQNDKFIQQLPMDDKRIHYLQFHHQAVFKGSIEE